MLGKRNMVSTKSFDTLPSNKITIFFKVLLCTIFFTSSDAKSTLVYNLIDKQPISTFVGDVFKDSNVIALAEDFSQIRFKLKHNHGLFFLDESGKLFTNKVLEREKICPNLNEICQLKFDIVIKYFQSNYLFEIIVNLISTIEPSSTVLKETVELSISETARIGSVHIVRVPKGFYDGKQEYTISGETEKFELEVFRDKNNNRKFRLKLLEKLDREVKDSYSIMVTANNYRESHFPGSILINISVADFNDNSPSFTREVYTKEIPENTPVGTMILRVSASDPDLGANGQVTYSFSDQTVKSYGNYFWIKASTGQIFTKEILDYEKNKEYSLTVQAIDGGIGSLPMFAKVIIKVTDINDNEPEINVNVWTDSGVPGVNENANEEELVAQISVSDLDQDGEQEVKCSIDNNKYFKLVPFDKNAYKLDTKTKFDREKTSSIKITITCKDTGYPPKEKSKEIEIEIIDENDNSPVLSSSNNFTFYVYENNKVNFLITKINATDLDSGVNSALQYSLEEIPKSSQKVLKIDPTLGMVTANIAFDYEKKKFYKFLLKISDSGTIPRTATATLELHILDVNDEKPKFEKPSYYLSVPENNPIGSVIGRVNATDADASDEFKRIIYRIESSDDAFEIDANTGEIKNLKRLDREDQPLYKFQVVATNPGILKVESKVNVTVYVDDVNDNAPLFVVPQTDEDKIIQISADSKPGTLVTRLIATDADIGANAELVFTISNGNVDNSFSIDPTTGVITVANSLKTPDNQDRLHKLVISVSDLGNPSLMTVADLDIMANHSISLFGRDDTSLALTHKISDKHILLMVALVGVILIFVIFFILLVICINKRRRKKRNEGGKYLVTRVVEAYESESQGKSCRSPACHPNNNSTSTMECHKLGVGNSSITVDTSSLKSECNCNNRTNSIPPPPPPNIMSPLCRDEDDEDIEVCRIHEPNMAMMATSWDPNQNIRITPVSSFKLSITI